MHPDDLAALTARIRSGDAAAAAEFVRRFEPQIRRAIRIRGTGQPLQRVLDSEEVCQSVVRRLLGQMERAANLPADPVKLLAWLLTTARNRRREALRRELARKRGGGRVRQVEGAVLDQQADAAPAVGVALEHRELLEQILAQLGERERRIARLRAEGLEWEEIARELGAGAEALRKAYHRALSRVVEELEGEQPFEPTRP